MAKLSNKQLTIMAAAVTLVIVAAVVLWLVYFQSDEADTIGTPTPTPTDVAVVNATITNTATLTPTEAPSTPELEVTRVANLFAERYGSYSSDADYKNIVDLQSYMTPKMKQSADDFIKIQRAQNTASTYTVILTDVLATTLEELVGDRATVRITTQRTESGDSFEQNDVYYQDIVLKMIEQDSNWIIDQAVWQEKGVNTQVVETESPADDNASVTDLQELLQTQ